MKQDPKAMNQVTQQDLQILVIEDDPADRALYRLYLSADSKYRYSITECESGSKAIEQLAEHSYDCILLDYRLPDMSGMELLGELTASRASDELSLVMLTSQGSETIAVEALQAGATDYLPKRHLSTESLKRTVHNTVEKATLRRAINEQHQRLEEKNQELLRKHDEILRFYQTVSHELKTPLSSMQEFISIVIDGIAGAINSEQKEYLELARESCQQMTHDVNDLLDVTRLETGKYRVDIKESDVGSLLSRVVQSMSVLARDKSINIVTEIESGLPLAYMDRRRIEQVLTNLISNAIQFTDDYGQISCIAHRVEDSDEYIEVRVKDNGCGIKQENLSHVFDRLYQVESDNDYEDAGVGGLGLGLTISKELIDLHGGHITVNSLAGEGSEFIFTLPVSTEKELCLEC